MNKNSHILIIGGGLAGLTSAIHLAKYNIPVTLIEKDVYPKHKVCGEYISNEILPYFEYLDINIEDLNPIRISKLNISTGKGLMIKSELPLGGFGVSRYDLDYYLWNLAKSRGVQLVNDQVLDVKYTNDYFEVTTSNNGLFTAKYTIGAYGKRSIIDRNLERSFSKSNSQWLGVKAHYKADFPSDLVALHNFEGGYCGLSKVDNTTVNACYLVNYKSFQRHKNIANFQKKVMYQNPHLESFFENAATIFDKPITISQINFENKEAIVQHVFMIGDAAGLIHPLCGNGMAMGIQASKILCTLLVTEFDNTSLSRQEIEMMYTKQWKKAFTQRLNTGRFLQKILLKPEFQIISQKIASILPSIVPVIIKQTHGKPLVC